MSHPYLIALDVDGTLIDYDTTMSDRVRDAVQAVAAAGHQVVIATGRQVEATFPVIEQLGLERGIAVCSNGAVTVRFGPEVPRGYELLSVVTFDPGPVLEHLRASLPDALYLVEIPGVGTRVSARFPPGELDLPVEVVEPESLSSEHASRVVVRSPDHTAEEFDEIARSLGLHEVTYAIGWTAWLDIAPKGVHKGSALEQVRRELDIDPRRTLAIGDGRNDIEMFNWAARSFAMGTSADEVIAAADDVCPTVYDDGAASVLEGLLASPEYRD